MKGRFLSAWVLLFIFTGGQATAEDAAPQYRGAAVELADLLQAYYLFPDVGEQYSAYLRTRAAQGDYDALASDAEFAAAVTDGLKGVSSDAHLRVRVASDAATARRSPQGSPRNVIQNATWLADGVAYVAITGLPESVEAQQQMARFLDEYEGTDNLVLDLRFCPGGTLSVMDVLLARLYGEPTHLLTMDLRSGAESVLEDSLMNRPSLEQQDAPPGLLRWQHVARPSEDDDPWASTSVFVLTDLTASACEHLTLALKGTGRATIVGGPTRGAGHFGNTRQFGDGRFEVFVPVGRTYEPQTGKGWEGGGIAPHVAVPPEKALEHVIGELGIAPDEVTLPPPPAMPRMQRRESASGQRGYGIGMLPPQSGASSIRVVQVIDGGVAQRCGVRAGDRIVSIDGKAVSELEQGELRGLMRQSPLVLEIERDGEQLEFELSLD